MHPAAFDPHRVVLQVECTDFESGSRLVGSVLGNLAKMVGAEDAEIRAGPAKSTFGWVFYPLAVSKRFVTRLASLPENDITRMKGGTLDQKFAAWLDRQLKARLPEGGEKGSVHVRLLSDLCSPQFGLF
ncbi:hypothetical protein [Nitrososphaera sp.]|uniref:hypothetical protein n=1 Tax=Nitrososphaera sp. TaxID=1971748 RepID=UPI00307F707B